MEFWFYKFKKWGQFVVYVFLWCSGYQVCLTCRRSPVRSRAETFNFLFFTRVCTSKFCFVVFHVVLVVVLGADTLIRKFMLFMSNFTSNELQWQVTKLRARSVMSCSCRSHNCARAPQWAAVSGHQTAWQVTKLRARSAMSCSSRSPKPCPAALLDSLAWQPCPVALPVSLA
jgi:hypothetical protein